MLYLIWTRVCGSASKKNYFAIGDACFVVPGMRDYHHVAASDDILILVGCFIKVFSLAKEKVVCVHEIGGSGGASFWVHGNDSSSRSSSNFPFYVLLKDHPKLLKYEWCHATHQIRKASSQ